MRLDPLRVARLDHVSVVCVDLVLLLLSGLFFILLEYSLFKAYNGLLHFRFVRLLNVPEVEYVEL